MFGRVVHPSPTHESRIWPLQSVKLVGTETLMAILMVVDESEADGGGSRCINPTHSGISLRDR